MTVQAVILAAGMGTRLGRPWPKPLTPLDDGRTIMQQQIENLREVFPDVLWMNGDVVFDPAVLERCRDLIAADRSFICVNTAAVAEEEVKYTVDAQGHVDRLSKTVTDALGEAVGINYVSGSDKAAFIERLAQCADQDYFERGIELMIENDQVAVLPLDAPTGAADRARRG